MKLSMSEVSSDTSTTPLNGVSAPTPTVITTDGAGSHDDSYEIRLGAKRMKTSMDMSSPISTIGTIGTIGSGSAAINSNNNR